MSGESEVGAVPRGPVLVTGATGFLGGALVQRLLQDGARVRALVRSRDKAAALVAQGVQTVVGDMSDDVAVVSESVEFERDLGQAARLRGADRLDATLAALEIVNRGPYMPGIESGWVDDRRQRGRRRTRLPPG